MLGSYGRYKKRRNAAWQILIDNEINSLPVDVVKIANNNNISLIKNSAAQILNNTQAAISINSDEKWMIIYDNTMDIGNIRITIAHELGHIFLGHPIIAGYYARSINYKDNKSQIEMEAESFALRLLTPACVLWGLNIKNTEEIIKLCKISKDYAVKRAIRMEELYKKEKFLTSPIEKKLYNQFNQFIENFNTK